MCPTKQTILFLLIFSQFTGSIFSAEWEEVDSDLKTVRTETQWFYGLTISSATTWWAVAIDDREYNGSDFFTGGLVFKTGNGGKNWALQPIGCTYAYGYKPPLCISFADEQNGWVLQGDTLHHTVDGGITWSRILPSIKELRCIYFLTEKNGVANKIDTMFYTEDSGLTWSVATVTSSTGIYGVNDIHFTDSLKGWLVGGGYVMDGGSALSTIDGGRTWAKALNNYRNYALWAMDSLHIVTAGISDLTRTAVICITSGGGKKSLFPFSSIDVFLSDMAFITPQTGIALSTETGHILETNDSGNTWIDKEISEDNLGTCVFPWDNSMYIMTVKGKIFRYAIPVSTSKKSLLKNVQGNKRIPQKSVVFHEQSLVDDGYSLLGRRFSSGNREMASGVIVKKVPKTEDRTH